MCSSASSPSSSSSLPIESSLCCLYTHGYGTIHWHMIKLLRTTPLKKTDSTSPRSYQLSITPQLGIRGSWVQWSCHVQESLFHSRPPWPLALVSFLYPTPLPWWSLSPGSGSVRCSSPNWALHRHLFSALWTLATSCFDWNPSRENASQGFQPVDAIGLNAGRRHPFPQNSIPPHPLSPSSSRTYSPALALHTNN